MSEGFVFVALDDGSRMVRIDQIVHLERLDVDGPGDRTMVYLKSRGSFSVIEPMEDVLDKMSEAFRASRAQPPLDQDPWAQRYLDLDPRGTRSSQGEEA